MLKRIFLTGFLFLISCPASLAAEKLELYVGQIKILKVKDIKRIAVGNASVLSTSLLNNGQLLIIGEAPGDSNMHVWFNDGSEEDYSLVIKQEVGTLAEKAEEIRDLLRDVTGMNVRVVGKRIVLSGKVDKTYETAITTVLGSFPDAMDLTQKLDPKEYDVLDLPNNKMVYMSVKFTEFNKNYLESLGIQWDNAVSGPSAALAFDGATNSTFRPTPATPPSFAGTLGPTTAESALGYFGIVSEITSRINFAVNSGNALILAEPRLAARSGGSAKFLAGGEFPISISNINGTTIEFKEFGIQLSVTPEVDRNNNIRAEVETEVSAIDNSVAVQGVPGLLTRKTSTAINMRSGETLVISGLINQQASKDINGLKFLSDIPILGELFKSKNFRNQKTELVIFVTPTVFDASSDINQEAIKAGKEGIRSTVEIINEKSLDIVN